MKYYYLIRNNCNFFYREKNFFLRNIHSWWSKCCKFLLILSRKKKCLFTLFQVALIVSILNFITIFRERRIKQFPPLFFHYNIVNKKNDHWRISWFDVFSSCVTKMFSNNNNSSVMSCKTRKRKYISYCKISKNTLQAFSTD